ncbi:unnamed protein product [Danaus chrysippus]|uniref:(African queen) hypothetical protein n=1 Tax=Danaus chrysippus TaxID=151541 RepID=A0A8J2RA41_9NEOP|nr:unnamed protein product [Danaus chrysippus]
MGGEGRREASFPTEAALKLLSDFAQSNAARRASPAGTFDSNVRPRLSEGMVSSCGTDVEMGRVGTSASLICDQSLDSGIIVSSALVNSLVGFYVLLCKSSVYCVNSVIDSCLLS